MKAAPFSLPVGCTLELGNTLELLSTLLLELTTELDFSPHAVTVKLKNVNVNVSSLCTR